MNARAFVMAVILIFLAGIVLYMTNPKYQVSVYGGNIIKVNKVTGKVLAYSPGVDPQGKPTKFKKGWMLIN